MYLEIDAGEKYNMSFTLTYSNTGYLELKAGVFSWGYIY